MIALRRAKSPDCNPPVPPKTGHRRIAQASKRIAEWNPCTLLRCLCCIRQTETSASCPDSRSVSGVVQGGIQDTAAVASISPLPSHLEKRLPLLGGRGSPDPATAGRMTTWRETKNHGDNPRAATPGSREDPTEVVTMGSFTSCSLRPIPISPRSHRPCVMLAVAFPHLHIFSSRRLPKAFWLLTDPHTLYYVTLYYVMLY